jgi:outer membrane protein assembly factor BamB
MWSPFNSRRRQLLAALAAGAWMPSPGQASPDAGRQEERQSVFSVIREWDSRNTVLAPLSLSGGQVLFAGDQTVGCISTHLPNPVWRAEHGLSTEAVFRPRAVGRQVTVGGLNELGSWDKSNGKRLWLHTAQEQMGTPCVTPNCTYVGDGHELLALDNRNGKVLWRFSSTPDTLASYAPLVADNTVFFCPGNGILYAVSVHDGKLKWQLDRGDEWQYLRQLHVTGSILVAGSYKELLYGISLRDGKVLWTFNAGNFINSHHVSGTSAYLWSPTGWIYAIDTQLGVVRWRHQTTNYGQGQGNWAPLMAELTTLGNRLFALDMNDVLHVLDTSTGQEIKRIASKKHLRPTVVPTGPGTAMVATDEGRIQQVRY